MNSQIVINDSCLFKRSHDWYTLQQQYQGWQGISPDDEVFTRIKSAGLTVNLTYAHDSLRGKFSRSQVGEDFSIISKLELSKLPLEVILKIVRKSYDNSKFGVYVALLSYYITPVSANPALPDSYKQSIIQYFQSAFCYASKIESHSIVEDSPISQTIDGRLVEGANFIFVHPNIRYYLWK